MNRIGTYSRKTAPPEYRAALLLLVARRLAPDLDFDIEMFVQSGSLRRRARRPLMKFVVPNGLYIDLEVAMSRGARMVDTLAEQSTEWLRRTGWLNERDVKKAIDILLNPHLSRYFADKVDGLTPEEAFARVMRE